VLTVRAQLVASRTRLIATARAIVRGQGRRVPSCSAEGFEAQVAALGLPEPLQTTLDPLLTTVTTLTAGIEASEAQLVALTRTDPRVTALQSVPCVGPITAAAFVATVDDAGRFRDANQVTAYLGLVPRDRSSGEGRRSGHITKAGPVRMRWLLVQAAWRLLRAKTAGAHALRQWGEGLVARRGKGIAVVALARRLARLLFALLRDSSTFVADHEARRRASRLVA